MNLVRILFAVIATFVSAPVFAEDVSSVLKRELGKGYAQVRIELSGEIHWTVGSALTEASVVRIQNETPRGEVVFSATDPVSGNTSMGWVSFSAWMPARIAVKRIQPGTSLTADQFKVQEINVAIGQGREFRGVILESGTTLSGLESRQTVLEGQFLLSSAVQRTPDVRRGDAVRVYLIANDLSLSTSGMAEEPGYIDGPVRVIASKNKRELVGRLRAGGIVEVKL